MNTSSFSRGALIAGAGFAAALLGSFLPWIRILFVTRSGVSGDGQITVALAVIGLIVIFFAKVRFRWVALLAAAAIVAVMTYEVINISSSLDDLNEGSPFSSDFEFMDIIAEGFVLTFAGGIVAVLGGFLFTREGAPVATEAVTPPATT